MSAQTRNEAQPQPDKTRTDQGPDPVDARWRALAVCLVAGFMTMLDVSIVNVALPSLKGGLHASPDDLQWVLSGYALAFGLILVPAGRLGDAYGRRSAFMIGLAAFTVTSAAAGLATGPGWLVAARFAQGLASGTLNPQVAGLIQQLFHGRERGRAFGLLGAVIGVSTALGPLLGGLLIAAAGPVDGWRWVFYVNVPIGLAALPAAYRLLPGRPEQQREQDQATVTQRERGARGSRPQGLDPVGVALLTGGVLLILLPLVEEQQWHGALKWLLLPAAALVLTIFVLWERRRTSRSADPLVDLALFRFRSYSLGSAIALVYFSGFTAIFFIFTLYVQAGLGYSALLAGAAMTPFAVGSGVASAVGGRVATKVGRPLIVVGLVLVALGLGATLLAAHLVSDRSVGWATIAPLAVAGLGTGLVIAPNQTITLSEVPVRYAGSAAGVLQTAQRIGSAVGIAAVGSVFFAAVGSAAAGSAANGGRPHDPSHWANAFQRGLVVAIGLVLLALAIAAVDVAATRRQARRSA